MNMDEKIKYLQKMNCYADFKNDIDAFVAMMNELNRRLDQ